MREIKITMLCRSLAGHDKGKVFAVLGEEGEYLLIADGRGRNAERPKRKKKKHVQIIVHLPEAAAEAAAAAEQDADIRKLLKVYKQENDNRRS